MQIVMKDAGELASQFLVFEIFSSSPMDFLFCFSIQPLIRLDIVCKLDALSKSSKYNFIFRN